MNNIEKMFNSLSEEEKKKAIRCKDPAEYLNSVCGDGVELTDDQMEVVSGGSWAENASGRESELECDCPAFSPK